MADVRSEIDAKITLYEGLVIDKVKTGREDGIDGVEYARYKGIVEGLRMASGIIDRCTGDDGR